MSLPDDIYNALHNSLNVPVEKYFHEYTATYPVVVFQEISNVPAMNGDNKEILRRVTFQISIGTDDDKNNTFESIVETVMTVMNSLDFRRIDSRDIFDKTDKVYWRVIRFVTLAVN